MIGDVDDENEGSLELVFDCVFFELPLQGAEKRFRNSAGRVASC